MEMKRKNKMAMAATTSAAEATVTPDGVIQSNNGDSQRNGSGENNSGSVIGDLNEIQDR